jgi:hypothetical protein
LAAWLIDAPAAAIRAAAADQPRGLALTALTGGILGSDMLRDEIVSYRDTVERYRQMNDERDVAIRTGFAKLTDACCAAGRPHRPLHAQRHPSGDIARLAAPDAGA